MMAQKDNEKPDLQLVEALLFGGKEIQLQRFERAETLAGRTPDFKVCRDGALKAYCEVKSPRDDWLDDQLDIAQPLQIVGGARPDPTFNRIARHILKAATQFEAVNAQRAVPNILVFVNHADASDYGDLEETLTGMFRTEAGERVSTMQHISDGRIRDAKMKIDLYAWIDGKTNRVQGYIFNESNPAHVDALCELLALDRNKIQR